jgi:GH15 family glucan-1,4-alpha-glucosidase
LVKKSVTEEDFAKVKEYLAWVVKYQTKSGVLAEQLNPFSGAPLSATPLVWSHAVYVETVLMYIERVKEGQRV